MADVQFGAYVAARTAKTALVTGDLLVVADSAASNVGKKITWGNLGLSFLDGAAATPSIAFSSDPNTGLFWVSAGILGVTGDGLEVVRFSATGGTTPQALFADGTAAKASISFATDSTMGIRRSGANSISFTFGGADYWTWTTSTLIGSSAATTIQCGANATAFTFRGRATTNGQASVSFDNFNTFTASTAVTQVGATFDYTINQTSTAAFTGLRLNLTQTALGSGHQTAINCAIASVSQFSVAAAGAIAFTPGTPATLGTTENNYAGAGFVDKTFVRLTGHASNSAITGFLAPRVVPVGGVAAAQFKILCNIGAPTITLNNQNGGSDEANRIQTATAGDIVMSQHDIVCLIYDSTSAFWRQVTLTA